MRRSDRISSQHAKTPLSQIGQLPSPLTHEESTATEPVREGTAPPPEGRPSQIQHRTPGSSYSPVEQLSSPPQDTQPFSQFILPSQSLAYDVTDEEREGVWGYLLPAAGSAGDTLVLKRRTACPLPQEKEKLGRSGKEREKGQRRHNDCEQEEEEFEEAKDLEGPPSGGYLLGRHPECDRMLDSPTISNRHCLIFSENKGGGTIAVLEDLSSNGTFVNEAVIGRNKRRVLQEGDEITILDDTRFVFRYPRSRDSSAFHKQYRILQELGKGHFATVYLCVEKSTGHRFAVKRFEKRPGDSSRSEGLQQEIAVLMGVSHPNLLCLKDTYDEDDGVYLILELAPEGELFNWIVMKQKLAEDEARKIFIQLFQGIKYLVGQLSSSAHWDVRPGIFRLMCDSTSVALSIVISSPKTS